MTTRARTYLTSMLISLVATGSCLAETIHHQTRFSVRFGGIEIGLANFDIHYNDKTYQIDGSGKTTGLAQWFAPTTGSFRSEGGIANHHLKPKFHTVSVKESKNKTESVRLTFSNDRVSDIQFISNKKRKVRKAPKYIPVEARHLAAVLDPVSPLVVPVSLENATNGHKVCNQRFPVFDGETRYDIKLSYKSTKKIKAKGYNGSAYVCKMRYVPVAGHKVDHRSVKEMEKNGRMEIWLAPMEQTSVFTPIRIVIGTKYGTFRAEPDYFGKAGS